MGTEHDSAGVKLDSTRLLGFRIGQIVVASHDITAGLYQPTVLCRKGTRLRVVGPSGNGLHPIGCCKVKDKHWNIAVSVCDIEKHNNRLSGSGEQGEKQ